MKLQFTNGYRPRFDQITRIMQFLLSQADKKKVSRQEIVSALGIPDKQVENLISMMTGFGLVLPRVTILTPLGKTIIQSDPYFDKLETLWIIHYIVSSNPKWVVWYRIVNTVFPFQDRYTVEQIRSSSFQDLTIHFSERAVTEKLSKEVGSVLAAYTRSELSKLSIIAVEGTGNFVKSTPVDIPDLAFLYCLIYYRDEYLPGSTAVNTEDVCLAENSPGRVFNLLEYHVRSILGNLYSAELIRLEQLANLDQVRLSDSLTQEKVLGLIYGDKDAS